MFKMCFRTSGTPKKIHDLYFFFTPSKSCMFLTPSAFLTPFGQFMRVFLKSLAKNLKKNLWPASHYFTWKTRARLFYTLYHLICQTILNIANARCLLPLKSLNLSAITHKLMKIEEPGLWHFKAYNSTFKVSYLTKT